MNKIILLILSLVLFSCGSKEAQPIKLNTDNCDFCKMSIADGKYGAEFITKKGRAYKFDDIMCMVHYCKANSIVEVQAFYAHDFNKNNVLIPAETAFFLSGGSISSPMNGNTVAFASENEARKLAAKLYAKSLTWKEIIMSK